jgi:transcription elongation factor Elf1
MAAECEHTLRWPTGPARPLDDDATLERITRKSPSYAKREEWACPRCSALPATLTLLTSMVGYFACATCGHTWNETRREPEWTESTDAGEDMVASTGQRGPETRS